MSRPARSRSRHSTCGSSRRSIERLETVEQLRLYKEEHDLPFVDPDREAALIRELKSANRGPLSEDGLDELITFVLDLVKREVTSPMS